MKLSNVLKAFGAAALVAGLTPYRITRDEETGEKKVRALFWEAASGPKTEGEERNLSVHLGFFSPVEQDDEPHFFADEITVEYTREDDKASDSVEPEETAADVQTEKKESKAAEPAEAAEENIPADSESKEEESGETSEEN